MENPATKGKEELNPSLKLALAMAMIQSRLRNKLHSSFGNDGPSQPFCSSSSESDAVKWKRKAKQRKEEILRLKEHLKLAEDEMQNDVFPQNVSCKCYFFDILGETNPMIYDDGSESDLKGYSDVLRRRFLRQVRLSERKRRRHDGTLVRSRVSDYVTENKLEQLRASVDFLVELCETSSLGSVEEGNCKKWLHQAVDFILDTLSTLSEMGNIDETVESVLSSLIMRLMRKLSNSSPREELQQCHGNFEFYVQHLLRKLGRSPYIGQRIILSVCQRISVVAESLLFMDPFDVAFPKMHNLMYLMIQLIELLISDHLVSWSATKDFDTKLMEEWVRAVLHGRKALEVLESRNGLYMVYMDRVIGDLTRKLGAQLSFLEKLQPDTLANLFG